MNKEKVLEKLEDLDFSQDDMLKDLDRTIEHFKKLEIEQKAKEIAEELQDLAKEQDELKEKNFDDVEKYGIVDLSGKIINEFETTPMKGLIEKPEPQNAPSNLAVLGRYILPPEVFNLLENTNPGVGNEIQLTDALSELLVKDGLNAVMTDADVFDCGNKLGYLSANLCLGIRDPKSRAKINAFMNKLSDDDF